MVRIVLEGFKELAERYAKFPREFDAALKETMIGVLLELRGAVPPYPPQDPDSTYKRTGTLGRSLGSDMGEGRIGGQGIYEVRRAGGSWQANFGTRVKYAPAVISDDENERAEVHKARWWTIKTIADRAAPKIQKRFNQMAERLGKWLDRPVSR